MQRSIDDDGDDMIMVYLMVSDMSILNHRSSFHYTIAPYSISHSSSLLYSMLHYTM